MTSPANAKRKIVVAVAWPYVNGDLHIGHLAGYLVPADVIARFHRFYGDDVIMVSGSDCYGTPITVEADQRKITPEALVAEYHPKTVELFKYLQLSFDNYTTTLTDNHRDVTQKIFLAMMNKDLIIKQKSKQYYSPVENRFLPDRYVEGTCPKCGDTKSRSDQCDVCGSPLSPGELISPVSRNTRTPAELRETEHYFIDWPKLQPFLETYVASHESLWRPWIRAETRKWLKEGLQPRSITRDLDWGVPIPDSQIPTDKKLDHSESKRLYVWFEAVIGYLSASIEWASQAPGRSWESFWKNDSTSNSSKHYYAMGKDNLVFHTLFWPAQLHSFDETLHLPDVQAINNFLNLDGQKFSKSRGVTISCQELVENFGLDPVRFYMATISPEEADSNFTYDEYIGKHNSVLIANIGNFINRTLKLSEPVQFNATTLIDPEVESAITGFLNEAHAAIEKGSIRSYADALTSLSAAANKFITVKSPWVIKDRSDPAYIAALHNSMLFVLAIQALFVPLMPETSCKLAGMLGVASESWPSVQSLRELLPKIKLNAPQALFAKIEVAKA